MSPSPAGIQLIDLYHVQLIYNNEPMGKKIIKFDRTNMTKIHPSRGNISGHKLLNAMTLKSFSCSKGINSSPLQYTTSTLFKQLTYTIFTKHSNFKGKICTAQYHFRVLYTLIKKLKKKKTNKDC